MFLYL